MNNYLLTLNLLLKYVSYIYGINRFNNGISNSYVNRCNRLQTSDRVRENILHQFKGDLYKMCPY